MAPGGRTLFAEKGSALCFISKALAWEVPMGYGICRVEKVKATSVGAMQYHNDREPGRHSNVDIDPTRTALNYELVPHADYESEVSGRIERGRESTRRLRKDAVVLVEGIVTASPEFFRGKSAAEARRFFDDAFDFCKTEFGESNMVHFTVHMDEETPHAHFGFVPLKDGSLAWKNFFPSKVALSQFQDRFFEAVSKPWGLERGERREAGANARRHKTVREQKAATIRDLDGQIEARARRVEGLDALANSIAPKVEEAQEARDEAVRAQREAEEAQRAAEAATEAQRAELERLRGETEAEKRRLESVQRERLRSVDRLESFEEKGVGELARLVSMRGLGERERAAEAACGRERARAGRLDRALEEARSRLRDLVERVRAVARGASSELRQALGLPDPEGPGRHFRFELLRRSRREAAPSEARGLAHAPARGERAESAAVTSARLLDMARAASAARDAGQTRRRGKAWQR